MGVKTPVDMHIHTNASDGMLEPVEVLSLIRKTDIKTFSVTDHDSVAALDEMNRRAKIFEMRLINGVELSSEYNGRDLHFLGYFINHHNKRFLDYLYLFRRRRYQRAEEIVGKLFKLGYKLSIDRISEMAGNGPLGRPHIADAMVEKRYVVSRAEAFDRFLGDDGPVYVEKYRITPEEVIALIHSIGGGAFLAHPGLSRVTEQEIKDIMPMGLDGIEILHPGHSEEDIELYTKLAKKYKLQTSGGSDFHGNPEKDEPLGTYVIDQSDVDKIEKYCDIQRDKWILPEEPDEDEELKKLEEEDLKKDIEAAVDMAAEDDEEFEVEDDEEGDGEDIDEDEEK